MGNFEKLSVLVIGVIIVMILVVAIHTWTSDPAAPDSSAGALANTDPGPLLPLLPTTPGPAGTDPWDPYAPVVPPPAAVPPSASPPVPAEPPSAAPPAPSAEPAAAPSEPVERRVKVESGDTLGLISQRMYGSTKYWPRIAEANNVQPERLRPGMELIIPNIAEASGGQTPAADVVSGASAKRGGTWKVKRGDTIQRIARSVYGSIERWPDIWFENMERIDDPAHLPSGVEIQLPN